MSVLDDWRPNTPVIVVNPGHRAVAHRAQSLLAQSATACGWTPPHAVCMDLSEALDKLEPFVCIRCFNLPMPKVA